MSPHKKCDLPVHIVEQHNDVLPFIHRAIASRKLPFKNIGMLHFDSHPDLLLPPKLKADTVFKPYELYEQLSIENWLLPLAYAKHLDHVIWVKPPWAHQMKIMKDKFTIGKCASTGYVRLTSKENYFLTDGLFQPKKDLEDTCDVDLVVAEMLPELWADLDAGYSPSESSLSQSSVLKDDLHDQLKDKTYILDIDLDFFSTANPFKDLLKPDQEKSLRKLYSYSKLDDSSDEGIMAFTQQRLQQLNNLEHIFSSLENKWLSCGVKQKENQDLTLCDLIDIDSNSHLINSNIEDLEVLVKAVVKNEDRVEELTFSQLHNFGCTLDDTELPHHISTDQQIAALLQSFKNLIEFLPKPSLVTIARSSDDDYCPKSQVDKCQCEVLSILEKFCGPLDISYDIE